MEIAFYIIIFYTLYAVTNTAGKIFFNNNQEKEFSYVSQKENQSALEELEKLRIEIKIKNEELQKVSHIYDKQKRKINNLIEVANDSTQDCFDFLEFCSTSPVSQYLYNKIKWYKHELYKIRTLKKAYKRKSFKDHHLMQQMILMLVSNEEILSALKLAFDQKEISYRPDFEEIKKMVNKNKALLTAIKKENIALSRIKAKIDEIQSEIKNLENCYKKVQRNMRF